MGKKRPRQNVKVLSPAATAISQEFRKCSEEGCPNIVSVVDKSQELPIRCALHRGKTHDGHGS